MFTVLKGFNDESSVASGIANQSFEFFASILAMKSSFSTIQLLDYNIIIHHDTKLQSRKIMHDNCSQ